jgi:hypothetical protein
MLSIWLGSKPCWKPRNRYLALMSRPWGSPAIQLSSAMTNTLECPKFDSPIQLLAGIRRRPWLYCPSLRLVT